MAGAKKAVPRLPRNYELAPGVMRFSRARLYHKRGVAQLKNKTASKKKVVEKKVNFVEKKIGGSKNGGSRKVLVKKTSALLPSGRVPKVSGSRKVRIAPLRKSITPGTVLIVLAGRHKGKRVVFLKQLERSGLLLVTGPHKLNSVPLRRIAQAFVIATSTKVDVSGVKLPEHINDKYFKRTATKTKKGQEANIFATGVTNYTVSDKRKADQKAVDSTILAAIRKNKEKHSLFGYLSSRFALGKNQYPHKLVF